MTFAKTTAFFAPVLVALTLTTAPAVAQDAFAGPVKARQGQFQIMAINLGLLGNMAKGEAPYDAEIAQNAADSLVGLSMIYPGHLFVEGSDMDALEGNRAKPTIWTDNADFLAKWEAFGEGALVMQAAAGNGVEALGPALGAIGGTCGDCHKAHRGPES